MKEFRMMGILFHCRVSFQRLECTKNCFLMIVLNWIDMVFVVSFVIMMVQDSLKLVMLPIRVSFEDELL